VFVVELADGSHRVESADDLRQFLVERGLVTEETLQDVRVFELAEGGSAGQPKGALAFLTELPTGLAHVPKAEGWGADDWQRYQRMAQRAYEHGLLILPDSECVTKLVALRASDLMCVAEEPFPTDLPRPVLSAIGYLVARATPPAVPPVQESR
jgi:hypothetical protein